MRFINGNTSKNSRHFQNSSKPTGVRPYGKRVRSNSGALGLIQNRYLYNNIVEVLGLNSEAASIISEYSSTLPKRRHIKGFKSLQDLTWTALFLAITS